MPLMGSPWVLRARGLPIKGMGSGTKPQGVGTILKLNFVRWRYRWHCRQWNIVTLRNMHHLPRSQNDKFQHCFWTITTPLSTVMPLNVYYVIWMSNTVVPFLRDPLLEDPYCENLPSRNHVSWNWLWIDIFYMAFWLTTFNVRSSFVLYVWDVPCTIHRNIIC